MVDERNCPLDDVQHVFDWNLIERERERRSDDWRVLYRASYQNSDICHVTITSTENTDPSLLSWLEFLSQHRHPNIVDVYAVRTVNLQIEYVRAWPRANYDARMGSFTRHQRLVAVLELANALSWLHSHGIVHGNLSTGVMTFFDDGVLKLDAAGMYLLQDHRTALEETGGSAGPVRLTRIPLNLIGIHVLLTITS